MRAFCQEHKETRSHWRWHRPIDADKRDVWELTLHGKTASGVPFKVLVRASQYEWRLTLLAGVVKYQAHRDSGHFDAATKCRVRGAHVHFDTPGVTRIIPRPDLDGVDVGNGLRIVLCELNMDRRHKVRCPPGQGTLELGDG